MEDWSLQDKQVYVSDVVTSVKSLCAALAVVDLCLVKSYAQGALDDLNCAESCETMADFAANLKSARGHLRNVHRALTAITEGDDELLDEASRYLTNALQELKEL